MVKFLQINLNHCCEAQNLLQHEMMANRIGVAIISEQYKDTGSPTWIGDARGKTAIWWNPELLSSSCIACHKGDGYILAKISDLVIISVYNSPNADLENMLEEIADCISQSQYKNMIIAGNFNARSVRWEDRITSERGEILEAWANQLDLRLVNEGGTPTCSRPQGDSIVDFTWFTPGLINKIQNWKVLEDIESYSDHNYITFELKNDHCRLEACRRRMCPLFLRWSFHKMDIERFIAAVELKCQTFDPSRLSLEECAERLKSLVTEVCDFSTPRQKSSAQAYWWNEQIAKLRSICTKKRRNLMKVKRKMRHLYNNLSEEDRKQLPAVISARTELRVAKNCLVTEIRRSKTLAWKELITTLDRDPWGRPYKVVLSKLRKVSPSVTETLDSDQVACILDELFPDNAGSDARLVLDVMEWEENPRIYRAELQSAIKRKGSGNVAPGPDGLLKYVWLRVPDILLHQILEIFNRCLTEGNFPKSWKIAKLVLIPKPNNKPGELTKYRPICLLNEIGKIFERVIIARLNQHMATNSRAQLSGFQFGFRTGRSTTDALLAVRGFTDLAFAEDQCVAAVALDIKNTFNSLPWGSIISELERKGFPRYLVKIISSYLSNRGLLYVGCDKELHFKNMTAGVPQGSILDPLL